MSPLRNLLLLSLLFLTGGSSLFGQWTPLTPVPTSRIEQISFPEGQTGFVAGVDSGLSISRVYKTTDGGNSWNAVNWFQINDVTLLDFYFLDNQNGFVGYRYDSSGSLRSGMVKTTDGGNNWTDVTPNSSSVGYGTADVYFLNVDTGFYSIGSDIYRTTDAGANWTVSSTQYEGVNDMQFIDNQNGIAVGWDGTFAYRAIIWRTQNAGATWDTLQLSTLNSQMEFLSYPAANKAYALNRTSLNNGPFSSNAYESTDGGMSWDSVNTTSSLGSFANLSGMYFGSVDSGWVSTSEGIILKTQDGGENWTQSDSLPLSINDMYFNNNDGYVGGVLGKIYKLAGPMQSVENVNEASFSVSPNPSHGQFVLRFAKPLSGSLKVYDLQGKEVRTHNFQISQSIRLNLSDLSSGTYFLQVVTPSNISNSKVLVW